MSQDVGAKLQQLDLIVSQLREVKFGDVLLPDDHNNVKKALELVRDILRRSIACEEKVASIERSSVPSQCQVVRIAEFDPIVDRVDTYVYLSDAKQKVYDKVVSFRPTLRPATRASKYLVVELWLVNASYYHIYIARAELYIDGQRVDYAEMPLQTRETTILRLVASVSSDTVHVEVYAWLDRATTDVTLQHIVVYFTYGVPRGESIEFAIDVNTSSIAPSIPMSNVTVSTSSDTSAYPALRTVVYSLNDWPFRRVEVEFHDIGKRFVWSDSSTGVATYIFGKSRIRIVPGTWYCDRVYANIVLNHFVVEARKCDDGVEDLIVVAGTSFKKVFVSSMVQDVVELLIAPRNLADRVFEFDNVRTMTLFSGTFAVHIPIDLVEKYELYRY